MGVPLYQDSAGPTGIHRQLPRKADALHLPILSSRAFFLLPSVCNDWLPNRKNPLIYSSKHIAMSHPVLAHFLNDPKWIWVTWVAWVISGDSSHPAPPGYLLSLPCAPELASSDWSFTLFFALTWYLYDSPHLSLDVQNIMHFSWRKKIWSTSRRVLWNKRFRSNLSPNVPELRVWGIALF